MECFIVFGLSSCQSFDRYAPNPSQLRPTSEKKYENEHTTSEPFITYKGQLAKLLTRDKLQSV